MTLPSSQLMESLHSKQEGFKYFRNTALRVYKQFRQCLGEVSVWSSEELEQQLSNKSCPGARPLESLGDSLNWHIPCGLQWSNRQQSLDWVKSKLMDVTTFAVDGSQIYPNSDLSIPVALVQVGWFLNPHSLSGSYEKNVKLEVLSPQDLEHNFAEIPLDRQVNMQRFRMETERIIEFMEIHDSPQDSLVFMDGSLVATFAEAIDPECRAFYVNCILRLLRVCERTRVPLVAYIDNSNARDLVTVLQSISPMPDAPNLTDAALLGLGMRWGDRTPLFQCARGKGLGRPGVLQSYEEHSNQIVFTYLKTCDRKPARLEMPRWMVEDGIHEKVLDYVRAEVIVGAGYPYVIETADQVAVIQNRDQQYFYRLLQDWAATKEIPLTFSRKLVSKMMRR